MAGGSGTRFWPLSRRKTPKQFLSIGTDKALIVETIERLAPLIMPDRVKVVAGISHTQTLRETYDHLPTEAYITEPCARNTAPCIGLAAVTIAHENPDAVMAVLPSDHHIGDAETYRQLVKLAVKRADEGEFVTLGIQPTRPETGYGYIECDPDENLENEGARAPVFPVRQFVEKPDKATAQTYVETGRYLWNSGMFFFKASELLAAFEQHLPEMYDRLMQVSEVMGDPDYADKLDTLFSDFQSISFDYGIMEPLSQTSSPCPIRVIPAQIGWNDVGHWAALEDFAEFDDARNVIDGDAIIVDSHNNIVHSNSGTVALVGVEDLVVVHTPDATLVMPKNRSQDVRAVVDALKVQGKDELL